MVLYNKPKQLVEASPSCTRSLSFSLDIVGLFLNAFHDSHNLYFPFHSFALFCASAI